MQKLRKASKPALVKSGEWQVYVVRSGDTVEKIARRHGTTIRAIKVANNLKNDLLHPGQKLRVSSEKPKKNSNEA
jgi:LysM repeat protein